jgi:hypothetical protein
MTEADSFVPSRPSPTPVARGLARGPARANVSCSLGAGYPPSLNILFSNRVVL